MRGLGGAGIILGRRTRRGPPELFPCAGGRAAYHTECAARPGTNAGIKGGVMTQPRPAQSPRGRAFYRASTPPAAWYLLARRVEGGWGACVEKIAAKISAAHKSLSPRRRSLVPDTCLFASARLKGYCSVQPAGQAAKGSCLHKPPVHAVSQGLHVRT
ncbi:hypothetical protein BDZ91DRAFT_284385 [Kalaharituber pfeilii]|nr:hypothetical protein BDZ91DRAFT_284385 [Kalaharituber pfeilii]